MKYQMNIEPIIFKIKKPKRKPLNRIDPLHFSKTEGHSMEILIITPDQFLLKNM